MGTMGKRAGRTGDVYDETDEVPAAPTDPLWRVKGESDTAYRSFLLWILGGEERSERAVARAMSPPKSNQKVTQPTINRRAHTYAWKIRLERTIAEGLDPELKAYEHYRRCFLLSFKGKDVLAMSRMVVKPLGLIADLTEEVLREATRRREEEAGVTKARRNKEKAPPEDPLPPPNPNPGPLVFSRSTVKGTSEDVRRESTVVDPGFIEPEANAPHAPGFAAPGTPSVVRPKRYRKPHLSPEQVNEILKRIGGDVNREDVERLRGRIRVLAPRLEQFPDLWAQVLEMFSTLEGQKVALEREKQAKAGNFDFKLVDATLKVYASGLSTKQCPTCGKSGGVTVHPRDLPALIRTKMLLEGAASARTETTAPQAMPESVRVRDARKSGDPLVIARALRDEAAELETIFSAALAGGDPALAGDLFGDTGGYEEDDDMQH